MYQLAAGRHTVLSIVTGGDTPKGEALLVIGSNDHQLAEPKPGLYRGDIAITVRKDGALVVHIVPAAVDSKKYSKKVNSLLGKKLALHIVNVANDNIALGGIVGRTHHLAGLKTRKVERIVKRVSEHTVSQLRAVA